MGAKAEIASINVTRSSLDNRKIHFSIRFANTGDTKDPLWVKIVEYDEDEYVQIEGEGKTILKKKLKFSTFLQKH